jgi:nitrogen regulatory protein PII
MDDKAAILKLIAEPEYQIEFVPKIKIEVIIPDDIEEFAVNAVLRSAHNGKVRGRQDLYYSRRRCGANSHGRTW